MQEVTNKINCVLNSVLLSHDNIDTEHVVLCFRKLITKNEFINVHSNFFNIYSYDIKIIKKAFNEMTSNELEYVKNHSDIDAFYFDFIVSILGERDKKKLGANNCLLLAIF